MSLNGEDGLHLALSEVYDAAIIDIMLPKLDGLSLIEEMRQPRGQYSCPHSERQAVGGRPGQGPSKGE